MRTALFALTGFFVAVTLGIAAEPGTKAAKEKPGSALAEKRAAAAEKKLADTAKRTFTKFDANKDGKLDKAEWGRAQAALDKAIEGDVVKTAGAKREAVKKALAERAAAEVQFDESGNVTTEAIAAYAKTAAADAATIAKETAAQDPGPVVEPGVGGGRAGGDRGDEINRRREAAQRRANGERPANGNGNNFPREGDAASQRDQAIRDRATGGRDPGGLSPEARAAIEGATRGAREGQRPRVTNGEGGPATNRERPRPRPTGGREGVGPPRSK